MTIQLSPSWILTTERAESRYGVPVLVNRHDDGRAYGPADILEMYPRFGLQPAANGVLRLFKSKQPSPFTAEQVEAIRAFLGQWPAGPQLS